MKRLAPLFLILCLFASLVVGLQPAQVSARPLADTYSSQPDETSGVDTWIDSSQVNTNNGTHAALVVGESNAASAVRRSLIWFDLSSIPSNAVISSATLYMTISSDSSSNARDFSVYRMVRAWVESQATWTIAATGTNWGTAGASNTTTDYDSTAWATTNFSASESVGTEKSWSLNVTEFTKFVDGTYTNLGLIVRAATENNDQYNFYSSSNATPSNRPRLVVEYTVPTNTPTPSQTPSVTLTPSNTPTDTLTPSQTPTDTLTPSATPTFTFTPEPCALQATVTSAQWTEWSGVNNDVCTDNGIRYVWREPGAQADSTVDAAFTTNAETMYTLHFNGYYNGTHAVTLDCFNGSTWDNLATLATGQSDDETITLPLPQTCNDGSPSLRFSHASLGNASHYIRIDQLVLEIVPATETPTPTQTFTPSPTNTAAVTDTFTPTITFTPSLTPTPSMTLTPSATSFMPTAYFVGRVTYGDMAVSSVLACLIALLLLFLLYWLIRSQAERRAS